MAEQWRVTWAIAKKDLAVWLRSPAVMAATVLPSLLFLLILGVQAASVTAEPVAVVNLDAAGGAARALEADLLRFPGFRVEVLSAARARTAYARLRVAGVLTIPAGFSRALAAGRRPTLAWEVRNFNADSTNDLRRGLPTVLNLFLASGATGGDPVRVTVAEHDVHPRDAGFVAFEIVSILGLLLLQASVVNAGLAAVSEWETGAVKELLLSPAVGLSLVGGKIVAGVVAAVGTAAVVAGTAMAFRVLPPVSVGDAALALATMTLLAVFGAGIGVALAAALRQTERLTPVAINVAFYLFFLSGGIAALAYLPGWLRGVARVIPNTYAVAALRAVLLYARFGPVHGLPGDLLTLGVAAAVGVAVGVPALRRGLAH